MTFKEAYIIARTENEEFRKHEERILSAKFHKKPTACILFSIGKQAFYFGFDGVDMHKGVLTAKRSQMFIDHGKTLVIR